MNKKIPNQNKPYTSDQWNKWTSKSKNVPFKSSEKSVGDGEHKLGAEYNVKPLGQNSSHDLDILGEQWEVKKLDKGDSFRLGVEVAKNYTPVIATVIRILEKIKILDTKTLKSKTDIGIKLRECVNKMSKLSGNSKTFLLDGLRKNEVSESNLKKANDIIEVLKTLLFNAQETITLFSSIDGKKYEYDYFTAFKKISIEDILIEEQIKILGSEELYDSLLITNTLKDDLNIFKNKSLQDLLNDMVRNVFKDVKLVLVHNTNGYKPISNLNNIFCNRITSGHPRCKVK